MKGKSRIFAAAAALCVSLSIGACADFAKNDTYTQGQFTDVAAGSWYAESVRDAYEFGLMNGLSDTAFSPDGTLTVAQGVTIAARISEAVTGKTIAAAEGGQWYDAYVSYAKANGFVTDGQFDSFDREIKRHEMASLLADSVGSALEQVNTVKSIPDVPVSAPYYSKVEMLYKAGVLTGNDDYGSFAPESNLRRSEISAMAVRIADSTKRVKKIFLQTQAKTYSDAYYLIDAVSAFGRNGLANGWNYDNRFSLTNSTGSDSTFISDISNEQFFALNRDFDVQTEGVLRLELMSTVSSGDDGAFVAFRNASEQNLIKINSKDGKFVFNGLTSVNTDISVDVNAKINYTFIVDIDLDNNTAALMIDNVPCGSVEIAPDAAISRLVLGTTKQGVGVISLNYAKLSANYALNERFLVYDNQSDETPAGWDVSGDFKLEKTLGMRGNDVYSVKTEAKAGSVHTAEKHFSPVSGSFCFEAFMLLPEKTDGASVSVMSGENEVLKFETRDGAIYLGNNKLNDYIANIWQCLHIETDAKTGKADIKVNGKTKATVDFTAASIDGIRVNFAPSKDAVMWFDDVVVYNLIEHDDYPAYPKVANDDNYNIGVNECDLWRDTQSGEGWDSTSPFKEFDPYLGFYDDGLRETSDWQIKWMVEHGIDFMHICWYCPMGDIQAPIKNMRHSYSALHDGYMNAKYSDLLDFCIMWENNGQDVTSFEQFEKYIWNYWKEYYFSDPRYARLDNKAVLTVWNTENLKKAFGGEEGIKSAIQFMNDDLKTMGYDGLILLFSTQGGTPEASYTWLQSLGFAGSYGYHWGPAGQSAEHQISMNDRVENMASDAFNIPTVSVGFNDVGRNETRDPMITAEGHLKVCEHIKDILANREKTGTWKDNTLMVSTWNEFSEGTYVFPTESCGFSYLENIRKTFTSDTSDHTSLDVRPTQAQIDRVCHLYPENHSPIRRYQFEKTDAEKSVITTEDLVATKSFDMSTKEGIDGWRMQFGITEYAEENGVIKGKSDSNDYAICTESSFSIDAKDAEMIHIRAKGSALAGIEVYFLTESNTKWDAKKSATAKYSKADEFVDIYVDMTKNGLWNGKITCVRIDPLSIAGSFEISLIEFMKQKEVEEVAVPSVKINGTTLNFSFDPIVLPDGDLEIVGEARKPGFYSMFRVYHEWDRFTGDGVLTLKTMDEKTIVFRVGSSKVTVDGKEQELGYTFRLRDGLPVFQAQKLCKLLGYEYTMEGNTIVIRACTEAEYEFLKNKVPNQWEFEIEGELEGWKTQNCSMNCAEGFITCAASNDDPAVINSGGSFGATEYTKIIVGVKFDSSTMAEANPQLFYTTSGSTSFTGDKCINGKYNTAGKKDGDIVEVTFDLTSSAGFAGTINGIRFDPFGTKATFAIDYIRCVK